MTKSKPKKNISTTNLNHHNIFYDADVVRPDCILPGHVDAVRETLLSFDNILPGGKGWKKTFQDEHTKYNTESALPPDASYIPVADYEEESNERSQQWRIAHDNMKSCVEVAKTARKLETDMENGWTHFWRSDTFTVASETTKHQPGFHPVLDKWSIEGDCTWTEFDNLEPCDPNLIPRTLPKPDIAYAFPMVNRMFKSLKGAERDEFSRCFSLEAIQMLAAKGTISTVTTGLRKSAQSTKGCTLSTTDYACFPWAVVEVKKQFFAKQVPAKHRIHVERCYCQAANAAAAAIALRAQLFDKVIREAYSTMPPVIAFTCCGPDVRVWLMYYMEPDAEGKRARRMVCIWSTSVLLTWGVASLRAIITNMHMWASRILKPRIQACIFEILQRPGQPFVSRAVSPFREVSITELFQTPGSERSDSLSPSRSDDSPTFLNMDESPCRGKQNEAATDTHSTVTTSRLVSSPFRNPVTGGKAPHNPAFGLFRNLYQNDTHPKAPNRRLLNVDRLAMQKKQGGKPTKTPELGDQDEVAQITISLMSSHLEDISSQKSRPNGSVDAHVNMNEKGVVIEKSGNATGLSGQSSTLGRPASDAGLFGIATSTPKTTGGLFNLPTTAVKTTGGLFGDLASTPKTTAGLFSFPATAPETTAGGLFGNLTSTPKTSAELFGFPATAPETTAGGLFGNPTSTPKTTAELFGFPATALKTTTGGLLGNLTSTPKTTAGLFSFPATAPETTAGGLFGNPTSTPKTTAELFGFPATALKTTTGGLLSNLTSTPKTTAGLFSFLATAPETTAGGLFGNPTSTPKTSAELFGFPATAPETTAGGLFGNPTSTPKTTAELFGFPATAPKTTTGGLLGNLTSTPKTTAGLFSFPATAPETTAGGLFGNPTSTLKTSAELFGFPATAPETTAGGLFGNPTSTPKTTAELFGFPATAPKITTGGLLGNLTSTPKTTAGLFSFPATALETTAGGLFSNLTSTPKTTAGLFGFPATTLKTTTDGLFSNSTSTLKTTAELFGFPATALKTTTGGLFSNLTSTPKTTAGLFSFPATAPKTTTGGLFSNLTSTPKATARLSSFPATAPKTTTGGLFGDPTTTPRTAGRSRRSSPNSTLSTASELLRHPIHAQPTKIGLSDNPPDTTRLAGGLFGGNQGRGNFSSVSIISETIHDPFGSDNGSGAFGNIVQSSSTSETITVAFGREGSGGHSTIRSISKMMGRSFGDEKLGNHGSPDNGSKKSVGLFGEGTDFECPVSECSTKSSYRCLLQGKQPHVLHESSNAGRRGTSTLSYESSHTAEDVHDEDDSEAEDSDVEERSDAEERSDIEEASGAEELDDFVHRKRRASHMDQLDYVSPEMRDFIVPCRRGAW